MLLKQIDRRNVFMRSMALKSVGGRENIMKALGWPGFIFMNLSWYKCKNTGVRGRK